MLAMTILLLLLACEKFALSIATVMSGVQCTVYGVQCAVYSVQQCAVYSSVQYAVCSVQQCRVNSFPGKSRLIFIV